MFNPTLGAESGVSVGLAEPVWACLEQQPLQGERFLWSRASSDVELLCPSGTLGLKIMVMLATVKQLGRKIYENKINNYY